MKGVIRAASLTLRPMARCENCDWTLNPSRETRTNAQRHVVTTGHKVIVITQTNDLYRPTDTGSEQ